MIENEVLGIGRGRFIRYAPLILWTGVIFFLSSNQGSMAETSRFIRPIIEFFFPTASPDTFLLVHAFIRKTAHFVEYAVLAMFAAKTFFSSSMRPLRDHWYAFSILLVLIVAAIDETNQSTSFSRTGSGWDVLLDLSGGIAAICLLWIAQNKWPVNRLLQNNRLPGR
ncbi:MAG: VanZ family protein [Pyrinomonadaceae bacterium]